MRICSYVVKYDTGLAPNPFWGYCTLAVCTPNHVGVQLLPGDWIIGTCSKTLGNKLVYAMEIDERIYFDDYYRDKRFAKKRPERSADWKKERGDNMYYQDNGIWRQATVRYHDNGEDRRKDLKYPYVYVSTNFYYFGENAIRIPVQFEKLIWRRWNCKCDHDPQLMSDFIGWLKREHEPGMHGMPRHRHINVDDNEESTCTSCGSAEIFESCNSENKDRPCTDC